MGGLHILGTERHESRRIDNQLRGRSGRQGDKGSSRFYLSLEDDLLRIFGSEKISGFMARLGLENGQPIEHSMVSKAVANAQKKVEAHNFDIRKHLLEYDDVMNKQRELFYHLRREIISGDNQNELLFDMTDEVLGGIVDEIAQEKLFPEEWDIEALDQLLYNQLGMHVKKIDEAELEINGTKRLPLEGCKADLLHEALYDVAEEEYNRKIQEVDPKWMRFQERGIMLQVVDGLWKDHLLGMDHMKEGIGLRGYAQKNPLTEYKKEGFDMFQSMMDRIKQEITEYLFKVQITVTPQEPPQETKSKPMKVVEHRGDSGEAAKPETVKREEKKVGRNDPCPCGSGKKYKKCHGA